MDSKRRRTGDQDVSALRLASRQKYLAEREAQQLALLRRQVAEEAEEEERLGDKLSEKERREFAKNRETLKLAEARNAIDEHRDGYILPDADYSNKNEVLTKRHKEPGYEKSEVALWEEEQMSKIKAQVKAPERVQEQDYEYVFDATQEIAYVQDGPAPVDLDKQQLQAMLDEAEKKSKSIEETRASLPIAKYRDEFLAAMREHQALVFVGETGSGKTTQIPQYLLSDGYGSANGENRMIACTQPRRVAAMSVAKRVADEVGCKLGDKVGYSVRFDDKTGPNTQVKYMTDGVLLRELAGDATLSQYSVIMIDEAHERSIASDLLLPLVKELLLVRPELKLIISSATVDAEHFANYFNRCPCFSVPGRAFVTTIYNTPSPEANYLSATQTSIFQIHLSQPPGDILVFLTGQDEIDTVALNVEETAKKLGNRAGELTICPLYSSLPAELQQKAFDPTPKGTRKVILATNIAETSVTVPGIVYVIDCGYEKADFYNETTQVESLVVTPCSRAAANQRSGRAGRTAPGKCFRLYTKHAYYNELPASNVPSIQRANLLPVVLQLMAIGIRDLLSFDFLDAPSPQALMGALETLYALGGLTDAGVLSRTGRKMAEFPTSPLLARTILAASELGCVDDILTIVAMLGEAGALFSAVPKDKKIQAKSALSQFVSKEGGDTLTYLNIYNAWVESEYSTQFCKEYFLQSRTLTRCRDVREQLVKLCDRVEVEVTGSGNNDHVAIRRALTTGFFTKAARLQRDGLSYRTLRSNVTTKIHPSSVLGETRPKFVLFHELVQTSQDWMRGCTPIEGEWLYELAPHFYKAGSLDGLIDKKMPKDRSKTSSGHMPIKTRIPKGAAEVHGRTIQK
jgi:pre-mRNA-splicing factor ATP-dependent RNA helicase DHX16